ncbi:hypothetical protein NP493_1368g00013 [Ridgeia piscesae]|uniref:Uncharacterized protein n=1 Tax=Ridgeia piscesae TaxID=27915 RepID=A0AAD9NCK9_RIDPI|nr:hypothetical protein NP493_1368g00013 [Ridgeia piscesae]
MTEKEESNYLNWKTLHIHALGNAARDSSLGYLESYLNDSTINIALRSSAVDAIAKYKHKYIADVLLSVALTDQEENVRLAAVNGYKRHPHGGDIRTLLDPVYARSVTSTLYSTPFMPVQKHTHFIRPRLRQVSNIQTLLDHVYARSVTSRLYSTRLRQVSNIQHFTRPRLRQVSNIQTLLDHVYASNIRTLLDPVYARSVTSTLYSTRLRQVSNIRTLLDHVYASNIQTLLDHVFARSVTSRLYSPRLRQVSNIQTLLDHVYARSVTSRLYSPRLRQVSNIQTLLDPVYARSHNTTQVEHSRMKRSLSNSRSRIWKGFKFHKESPSVNWVEHTGGSKLGASIGVIIKNSLDIQIMPLLAKAKIDVLDTAWAEVHVGIFGLNYDIFRAQLCYKGGIEYGLNILKEYGYDQIQKFAELYDTVVNTVVTTIKDAVKSFKNLVSTFKNTDFSDIIDNLIESVKQLPRKVFNLRRIGKRIYKAIGKFVELPPVVTQVKGLITKVTTLFNDIKTDIMNLYDAIADSINTVVPWAWREIKRSYNGITKAIKKLLKNPQSAIQEIGEGIAR